jgi:hypothetical protein
MVESVDRGAEDIRTEATCEAIGEGGLARYVGTVDGDDVSTGARERANDAFKIGGDPHPSMLRVSDGSRSVKVTRLDV